jgi:hypothetical protein
MELPTKTLTFESISGVRLLANSVKNIPNQVVGNSYPDPTRETVSSIAAQTSPSTRAGVRDEEKRTPPNLAFDALLLLVIKRRGGLIQNMWGRSDRRQGVANNRFLENRFNTISVCPLLLKEHSVYRPQ